MFSWFSVSVHLFFPTLDSRAWLGCVSRPASHNPRRIFQSDARNERLDVKSPQATNFGWLWPLASPAYLVVVSLPNQPWKEVRSPHGKTKLEQVRFETIIQYNWSLFFLPSSKKWNECNKKYERKNNEIKWHISRRHVLHFSNGINMHFLSRTIDKERCCANVCKATIMYCAASLALSERHAVFAISSVPSHATHRIIRE